MYNNLAYSLINDYILNKYKTYIQDKSHELSLKNMALGAKQPSFSLGSKTIHFGTKLHSPINDALIEEATHIFNMRDDLFTSTRHIRACCSFLVPQNATYQDVRDSFSDTIVNYMDCFKGYKRTREPQFYIKDSPSKLRQWLKAETILERYIFNLMVLE